MGRLTLTFPNKRGVFVEVGEHGATFEYRGPHKQHAWSSTQEGLGNKNWVAEWMYANDDRRITHYASIGIDAAMMAVNDVIAQGAMPVVYTDEVAAGDSEWFADAKRANDLADGYRIACELAGMALPAGESPSLKYLVNARAPVKSAPSLSGCVTGIIAPKYRLQSGKIGVGDCIIGVSSWASTRTAHRLSSRGPCAIRTNFWRGFQMAKRLARQFSWRPVATSI